MLDRPPFVKPQQRAFRGARDAAIQQMRRELLRNRHAVEEINRRLDYVASLVSTVTHEDTPNDDPSPTD